MYYFYLSFICQYVHLIVCFFVYLCISFSYYLSLFHHHHLFPCPPVLCIFSSVTSTACTPALTVSVTLACAPPFFLLPIISHPQHQRIICFCLLSSASFFPVWQNTRMSALATCNIIPLLGLFTFFLAASSSASAFCFSRKPPTCPSSPHT